VLRAEPALDPELAQCLAHAARALPTVPLLVPGLVDLHIPLALHAERPAPVTAGCR
jgi:hypothetical protein